MEPDRALEIVQQLADGVDPYSGERFPADSPYQQADTVRALHLALEGLKKLPPPKARESRIQGATPKPAGPGRPWTEDEEKELLDQFDSDLDIQEIAKAHDRSKGAIRSRLEKLGRVQRRKDFSRSEQHVPSIPPASPAPTPLPAPAPDDPDCPF